MSILKKVYPFLHSLLVQVMIKPQSIYFFKSLLKFGTACASLGRNFIYRMMPRHISINKILSVVDTFNIVGS